MVFTEKSVIGLVLGLSLATNLTTGFVPHPASRGGSSLSSFANDEWFYEEKKTMYSEESTEKCRRIYNKRLGGSTKVFHDNYPLSPNKPRAQPSPYLPVALTSDNRWYQNESTLSYDATMRQRLGPSKPKSAEGKGASGSDEQGMRAPMPAVDPTNSTATTSESPYQPARVSAKTTKTAVSTIPVGNTVATKPVTPVKLVPLRPEDVDTTEGRWFNTESAVSYGNQDRSRKYNTIKVELREEEPTKLSQSPFVPVSADTTTAPSTKRSSADITTTLPLKTPKETDVKVSPAMMTPPKPIKKEETPEEAAARLAAIAASTVTTEDRWFNVEKRDFFRPALKHTPYTIRNLEYHRSSYLPAAVKETPTADYFYPINYTPVPAPVAASNPETTALQLEAEATESPAATVAASSLEDTKEVAPQPEPIREKEETPEEAAARLAAIAASTVKTEDRWFNVEKRDFFRPAQKHTPYTIRNPEYHRSSNLPAAVKETPTADYFVPISYAPAPAPLADLIALTATTDQNWFNSESKGTHYSGVENVRQHIPYTIRNPEYHRSPNMMRAAQETAAASPSAGAFVSVGWNPPPPVAAAATTTPEAPVDTTESKMDEATTASVHAEAVPEETTTAAAAVEPVSYQSATTTTDQKWFNSESKGSHYSGVKDVREHKPYQLIPKGDDEASIRTSD